MNTPTPEERKLKKELREKFEKYLVETYGEYALREWAGSEGEALCLGFVTKYTQEYAESYHASKMKERAWMPDEVAAEKFFRDRAFRNGISEEEWLKWKHTHKGINWQGFAIKTMAEYFATRPQPSPVKLPTDENKLKVVAKQMSQAISYALNYDNRKNREKDDYEVTFLFPSNNLSFQKLLKASKEYDKWSLSLTGEQEGWSRDYEKLFDFIVKNEGVKVPCMINYKFRSDDENATSYRDIAAVRLKHGEIDIGVRGLSYISIQVEKKDWFIDHCKKNNIEFILPAPTNQ